VKLPCLFFALPFGLLLAAQEPKLRIVQPVLHEYEDGPAVPSSYQFRSGEQIFLSARVAGFKTTPGEDKRVHLSYTVRAEDSRGVLLEPPTSDKIVETLSAEDKEWLPKITYSFGVPPLADPGTYRVRIAVQDELAGSTAQTQVEFPVRGAIVEPSDTLVIRNFRFLREPDERRPLKPPAYRPGDPVYARFEITGYKTGPNNALSVEYGIEVLRPNGERIFAEPKAAADEQAPFYPKRYIEGSLQLGFQPALAVGEYTVVVSTRDLIGNQVHEERFQFQIE
jgi:hypothetical protein